ncbi:MAG: DNA polymerase III subunit epsilon [Candidatus Comchoanobacterales bacterium]
MALEIAFDTETTGLSPERHRVIELGACVIARAGYDEDKKYHQYVNPQRSIDPEAEKVHGLSQEFLSDYPLFSEVIDAFLDFVSGHTLVIHNAPFDVGFMDAELLRCGKRPLKHYCKIIDSLPLARKMYPGQKNSLDHLCKRFGLDISHRTLHGALKDADLLSQVFQNLTTKQAALSTPEDEVDVAKVKQEIPYPELLKLGVSLDDQELLAHKAFLKEVLKLDDQDWS